MGAANAAHLTLSWVDNAGGTSIFKIERKTTTTGTYAQIATTGIGTTTYVDSAVVAGTVYCYRVQASNASGDSGYSNEACRSAGTSRNPDFDGDGQSDIAIYRDGTWFVRRSTDGGITEVRWGGLASDIPIPADYDGDGMRDIALYRGGFWYILRTSDGVATTIGWGGMAQDIPIPEDYDGDGKTDVAVYRNGAWYIRRSSDGGVTTIVWGGLPQDIPVPGDYDGDGKTDVAVYRDGAWYIRRSSDGGVTTIVWGGLPQDIPLN